MNRDNEHILLEYSMCTDHHPAFFDEYGTRILRSHLFNEKCRLPDSYGRYTWDGMSIKECHREKILSKWHALTQQERLDILRSLPERKGVAKTKSPSTTPAKRIRQARYSHGGETPGEGQEESLLTHAAATPADGDYADGQFEGDTFAASLGRNSSSYLSRSSFAETQREIDVRCLLQVIATDGVGEEIKKGAQDRLVELLGIKKRKASDEQSVEQSEE